MTTAREPFALTPQERGTELWRKLMEHFDERIQALRLKNDSPLDEQETARVRGEIAAFKYLKTLNTERQTLD